MKGLTDGVPVCQGNRWGDRLSPLSGRWEIRSALAVRRNRLRSRQKFTPVALPSGRLRLATRPSLTGSSLTLFASAAGSA